MTSPLPWVIFNVATAVIVAMTIVFMIARFGDEISKPERIGLCIVGAGMLLRIGPLIARNVLSQNSPFDDWSSSLMQIGMTAYILGWLWRKEGWHRIFEKV